MIFKQYDLILDGKKTATRRMRLNVSVGKTYAMVPKMSKPAHWFIHAAGNVPDLDSVIIGDPALCPTRITDPRAYTKQAKPEAAIKLLNYFASVRCEIAVSSIRHEPLWYITEADARAEGVSSVDEYAKLWDSINYRKGLRFDDNPTVYVIDFTISDRLHNIYNRWLENPVWQEVK